MSSDINTLEAQLRDALEKEINGVASSDTELTKKEEPASPFKKKRKFIAKGKKMFSEVYAAAPIGMPDFPITVHKDAEWSEEMQQHIPDKKKFDNYLPDLRYLSILQYAKERNMRPLVFGPTGSGKSSLQEYICAMIRKPHIRIQGRGDLETSSILGSMGLEEGKLLWHDGYLTKAVREGVDVLLDEGFAIPPEIMMSIQWLRERGGKLVLDDKQGSDKTVTPGKHFSMTFADNTRGMGDGADSFAGVQVQNTASINRFDLVVHMEYPGESHDQGVVERMFPEIEEVYIKRMVQLLYLIHDAYDKGELSLNASLRTIQAWGEMALDFGDFKAAFKLAFYNSLPLDEERAAVANLYQTVFGETLDA